VFESIGDDGSWFCNCVINKVRKSEKLLLRPLSALVPLWEIALAAAVVLTGVVDRILPLME
jgi:hypothetical protein